MTPTPDVVDSHLHLVDPAAPLACARRGLGSRPASMADPMPVSDALAAMTAVGVGAAIAVIPTAFGVADHYLLEAARRSSGRLRVVGLLDPLAPGVEAQVGAWCRDPMRVGLRIVIRDPTAEALWDSGGYVRMLTSCAHHGLTVCVHAPTRVRDLALIAARHPELRLVVDHLGLDATSISDRAALESRLAQTIALARFPNVAVKASALPLLSRMPVPFIDVQWVVRRAVDAFGSERVAWGSDTTRITHPYADDVAFIEELTDLTPAERRDVLGATARRLFDWPAGGEDSS